MVAAYRLFYGGLTVSLDSVPQLIPASLVRLDGSPALTTHYLIDLFLRLIHWIPLLFRNTSFLQDGVDSLTGYSKRFSGGLLVTAIAPLSRVLLDAFGLHDPLPCDIAQVPNAAATSATQTMSSNEVLLSQAPNDMHFESPSRLLSWPNDSQLEFLRL